MSVHRRGAVVAVVNDDDDGRDRGAVYLPTECWDWLERTARRDGTSRSDLLEGLVLLAMDDEEERQRRSVDR